jgi:hypothetical protein
VSFSPQCSCGGAGQCEPAALSEAPARRAPCAPRTISDWQEFEAGHIICSPDERCIG